MNKMSKIIEILVLIGIGVFAFISIEAFAGTKTDFPVSSSATHIGGSFGSARNSADTSQVLHVGDTGSLITIWSRDAAGTVITCTTNNAAFMSALRSATSNSYAYISHSAGSCTYVNVYKGSMFAPKTF